jgi:exodeoxyribonuclease-3
MRLLAWNIRAGGGARLAGIAAALVRHEADVVVLSEYRNGAAGERLRTALEELGYTHRTELGPPPASNGVLIAARRPFRERGAAAAGLPEPYRMLSVEFDGLHLYGIYMPNLKAKVPYWQALIAALAAERDAPALAIGDFNTCRAYVDEPGAIDGCAYFMDHIDEIGFCDLWRRRYPEGREYSWYSTRGNGFRIDHAFLSPALAARAGAIRYSHTERMNGLSDHSVLILDLMG